MLFLMMFDDNNHHRQSLKDVYNAYKKQMWYVAHKVLNDNFLAEDAVQDAFMGIAKNFNKIRNFDNETTRSYVLTAAYRAALVYTRKKKGADNVVSIENPGSLCDRAAEHEFDKIELEDLAYYIIKNMPDAYRDVLYLRFVLEMSDKEISDQLGRNVNTVHQQISRGRKIFIDEMQKEENKNGSKAIR